MSRFSGKSDLYDFIYMTGERDLEYLKRSKIYLGHSFVTDEENQTVQVVPGRQIHVNSEKDLVPYYAHVISMMAVDEDNATIYLMEESWPDIEKKRAEEHGYEYHMYDYYKEQLAEEMKKYGIKDNDNGRICQNLPN